MLRNGKRFRGEEDVSPNQHAPDRNPLLNQVILTRLFDFCPITELYEYRLVSKHWYSCSLPRIRNEGTVTITNSVQRRGVVELKWFKLHKDFIFDGNGKQFQSFNLLDVEFRDAPSPGQLAYIKNPRRRDHVKEQVKSQVYRNMDLFWVQRGQFIRNLLLVNCRIISTTAFRKAIFQQTPNMEKLTLQNVKLEDEDDALQNQDDEIVNVNFNLKHLTLMGCHGDVDYSPISWSVLFANFPNLEIIKHELEPGNAIPSLVAALELRDEIHLKVVKLYSITSEQSESVLRLLQLAKLKLKKLNLTFGAHTGNEESPIIIRTVKTAFQFQGDHLESLLVYGNDATFVHDESDPANTFPFRREPYLNLTCIDFNGVCPNFLFLQQTPNLKMLRLFYNERIKPLDEADFAILGSTKLTSLTEFYFLGRIILEDEMQRLVTLMPNMEGFRAFVNPGSFRVVCENWLNLRDLVVTDFWHHSRHPDVDHLGDEAITGIEAGREERLPNITNLQCLKSLKLNCTKGIGDASILNGFLKLPKLTTLHVSICAKTSKKAFAALRARIPDGYFV